MDLSITAKKAAQAISRLWVGAQNDALYLIDRRPGNNDHPVHDAPTNAIAKVYAADDVARRLAACWNACIGVPTSVLETAGSGAPNVREWLNTWYEARRVAPDGDLQRALDLAKKSPGGYAIQHADGKTWRTMDSIGMPDWTEDPREALVLRLRKHADAFAADDPEDVRIVPAPEVAS